MKPISYSHLFSGTCLILCIFFVGKTVSKTKAAKIQTLEIAQNTYFGPKENSKQSGELTRIELLVRDDPKNSSYPIIEVEFNSMEIPLKPGGIFGNRGGASFQLPAGKYLLKWKVQRDRRIYPRTLTFQKQIHVNGEHLWMQIIVEGDQATIN